MSQLDATLGEFGRLLQLEGLRLGESGVAALAIEGLGNLQLERHETGLVMLLSRELAFAEPAQLEKALELCDPREDWSYQPQAALLGENNLVFGMIIPEREAAPATLSRMLNQLEDLHERVTT